ncbi:integrin beta-PS-like [Leguminivora glycinivorella]|uniref:integrin beta-PS-like n=1 Tax=Leguminivora glycinivorella TaxID=1035111 RepID=UPI00200C583F|nr:integrin beta-PS-like [Leguminivora glycinivorella]
MLTQRKTLQLWLWVFLVQVCWANQPTPLFQLARNHCSSKTTCSDCIRTANCAWCFAARFDGLRCFNPAIEGTASCDEANILDPSNLLSVQQNMELSRTRSDSIADSHGESRSGVSTTAGGAKSTGSKENLVQIKPQRVKLQLRQNQMQQLSFTYSRGENYPLVTDSVVEIRDTSSDAIQIVYSSSCLDEPNVMQTNRCDGLKVGDVVEFLAKITLKECPRDPSKWKQTFVIKPGGTSEGLTVELEMICDCPCEHPGHSAYNDNRNVCSGHGISRCGVCSCQPDSFGKNCECATQGFGFGNQDTCRPYNTSTGQDCSGHGVCICGVCECNKMSDPTEEISGAFCECDNFSCDRSKGRICSGPDHGTCVCGQCICRPEYTGPACDCSRNTAPCVNPATGEICSGNGQCVCGRCLCNFSDEHHFSGRYCENCPTCPNRCKQFKECVLCMVHHKGAEWNRTQTCSKPCKEAKGVVPIVETEKLEVNDTLNEHLCSFVDEEDCKYEFVYSYDDQMNLHMRAQKEQQCPTKVR